MLDDNQKYAVARYALIYYFAKRVDDPDNPIKIRPEDFNVCLDFVQRNYQAYINSCDINYRKVV